jgi:pimeloyl-ACP methyl ester carboxylesterase
MNERRGMLCQMERMWTSLPAGVDPASTRSTSSRRGRKQLMTTTISTDGTRIAFDKAGQGPAVIFVDGALCYRASGPSAGVAELLKARFTVYTYDRRGRGESGNTLPYAVDREVEDVGALIQEAGGSAMLCGVSSGAVLSLEAASRLPGVTRLALYEAPIIVDDTHAPLPPDFRTRLEQAVAEGRRGDAVKMFLRLVGVPAFGVTVMRVMPVWKKLTAVAHTLPYDITIIEPHQHGKPLQSARWSGATMPALAIDGGKSPAWMRNGMKALAAALPHATYRTLPGQTHMVKAKVVVPVLEEFFANGR